MTCESAPDTRRSRLTTYQEVLLGTAATAALCYYGRLVLIPTLLGVAVALILAPAVRLLARFRVPRPLSALVLISVTLAVMYAVTHLLYDLVVQFVGELPAHSAQIESFLDGIRRQLDHFLASTHLWRPPSEPGLAVHQPFDWPKLVLGGANSVGEFLFVTSFVPFITYFLLTWQDHLYRASVRLFARDRQPEVEKTLAQIASMLRSVLIGNLLVGLLLGVLSSILCALVSVPYFYVIGMVSGMLSMVPYLGVVLALLPPILMGIGKLTGTGVLVLTLGVLLMHLLAINLLVPKLIGRRVQVNPLAATLSLLLWGVLWGGVGLILAVPIAAAAKIICNHIGSLQAIGAWLGDDLDGADYEASPPAPAAER
ncbi:MAG: AI-2E family transporter [Deltaproteobacteria bacterium]|nr:AI-2E family transporter [Deltaproteobacteria bacterium]